MAILTDVHIAIVDTDFNTAESVEHVLNTVLQAGGKSVLIVCRNMGDKAISVLATNNERGKIRSCAVKLVDVGEVREKVLTNLALITGGEFISDKISLSYKALRPQSLGFAQRITATRDKLTVIGGRGDKQAIRKRAQELRAELRRTPHPTDREHLRRVIAQLADGIGELRIGALTETERKAQIEVAEVAIRTVSACIEAGIVPGGGAAYLDCIPSVLEVQAEPGDESYGVQLVARALESPMRQIVSNAGLHPPLIIAEARRAGPGHGLDVRSKQVVKMIDEGIADSAYVARTALERAASAAVMLLTTDAIVLHKKPKESINP